MALFRASPISRIQHGLSTTISLNLCRSATVTAKPTAAKCVDDIGGDFQPIEYGNRAQMVDLMKQYQNEGIYTFTQSAQPQIAVFSGCPLQDTYKLDGKGSTHNIWPESWQMIIGEHALTLKHGNDHRRIRRVLNPLFTESSLKHHFDLIESVTQTFVDNVRRISAQNKSQYVQIWPFTRKWAFDIAAVMLFGTAGDATKHSLNNNNVNLVTDEEYELFYQECCVWIAGMADMDATNADKPGTVLYDGLVAQQKLQELAWRFVSRANTKKEAGELAENTIMYKLLSIPQSQLSKEELLDNVLFVFAAAFDTTSATLCNLFYVLYAYPREADKLRAEFAEFESTAHELRYDMVQSSQYLECFVKELMRFAPVVYGIPKRLIRDEVIADYRIPKDNVMCIDIVGQSRNERVIGDNVDTFDPTRFMLNDISHSKFSPFGLGAKMCLGWKLAYLELKVMSIVLTTQCRIELDESRIAPATHSHLYAYDIWAKLYSAKQEN